MRPSTVASLPARASSHRGSASQAPSLPCRGGVSTMAKVTIKRVLSTARKYTCLGAGPALASALHKRNSKNPTTHSSSSRLKHGPVGMPPSRGTSASLSSISLSAKCHRVPRSKQLTLPSNWCCKHIKTARGRRSRAQLTAPSQTSS
jgi:hypothetical protein